MGNGTHSLEELQEEPVHLQRANKRLQEEIDDLALRHRLDFMAAFSSCKRMEDEVCTYLLYACVKYADTCVCGVFDFSFLLWCLCVYVRTYMCGCVCVPLSHSWSREVPELWVTVLPCAVVPHRCRGQQVAAGIALLCGLLYRISQAGGCH